MSQDQTLNISWDAIGKVFIAGLIVYAIYQAKEIALWFFFGLAISVLLEPAIKFLRKLWLPKMLAIVVIYLSIFGTLGLLIYITAPIFVYEIKQFSQYLPNYISQINPVLDKMGIDAVSDFNNITEILVGGLEKSSKGALSALMAFFGGLSSTVVILTIAFFLSLEDNGPERFLTILFPKKYEERITVFFDMAQGKVAGWFGARLLACLFVGVASFIVFYIFGVKYAFMLALLAGVLNFIPYIGPLTMGILLVVFVAVSSGSWATVVYVLLSAMAIQSIENNLLTPLLMKRLIAVPPVLVLVSLLMGAKMFGFLGTIFAVPVAGIIYEFVKELLEKRREDMG